MSICVILISCVVSKPLFISIQARELFLQGVEFEQDGKLFDAILKYKKAVHLVPGLLLIPWMSWSKNFVMLWSEKNI